jgi:hypothetical protein
MDRSDSVVRGVVENLAGERFISSVTGELVWRPRSRLLPPCWKELGIVDEPLPKFVEFELEKLGDVPSGFVPEP